MARSNRRKFLTKVPVMAAAAVGGASGVARGDQQAPDRPVKKVHWSGGSRPERTPLFSGVVSYGNLVFISGIGAHFPGDITAHTDHVLTEIQRRLEDVGSSMQKVLKVNVYLNDLKDYQAMNEVFLAGSVLSPVCAPRLRRPAAFPATRSSRSTASRTFEGYRAGAT